MIFKDLLFRTNIDEVLKYLFKIYSDEVRFEEKYKETFNKLRGMEPEIEKDFLELFVVEQKEYLEDGETYIGVYGVDRVDREHYALDFTPWDKWLGMTVVEKSVEKYGVVCFVAECLHEMTFISFDEVKIQEELEELNRRVEIIEKGEEKFYTFEEVVAHLNEEFGFDCKVTERTLEEKEEDKRRYEEVSKFNEEKMNEVLK